MSLLLSSDLLHICINNILKHRDYYSISKFKENFKENSFNIDFFYKN